MTTLLVTYPETTAGCAPFPAVRWEASPADAKLRQQMREFVTKRAIDFGGPDLAQPRIQ